MFFFEGRDIYHRSIIISRIVKIDEFIRSAFVILGEAAGDVMEAIRGESKQLL